MEKLTEDKIKKTRNYFIKKGYKEITVELGGRKISYFVIPQALEPNLPNFVIRVTGNSKDDFVFGISDSVNKEYQPYVVAHEYIEFLEIGINAPDRCVKALEEELKLVYQFIPNDLKPGYVKMRRDFFRDLISYCSEKPKLYTEDEVRQFKKNLETLEEILK